jgi:hypothetical protein
MCEILSLISIALLVIAIVLNLCTLGRILKKQDDRDDDYFKP